MSLCWVGRVFYQASTPFTLFLFTVLPVELLSYYAAVPIKKVLRYCHYPKKWLRV
jgi:hypothetical protein